MNEPIHRIGRNHSRRGMLLLMTLSMLTLFLLMGGLAIVLATRARESARAFANATSGGAGSQELARSLLDEALMTLLRGSKDPNVAAVITESILGDKYGAPQQGQLTALQAEANTPLLRATITGLDTANPVAINGRIVTFKPKPIDSTEPTSYRIIRAEKNGTTFWLANLRPSTPEPLPSTFPCDVIVNAREFAEETYDSFEEDEFLTWPILANSRVSSVKRAAFGKEVPNNPPEEDSDPVVEVDNDGDGILDGCWLPREDQGRDAYVLAPRPAVNGGEVSFRVSYLVLDLDGRININAHGSLTPVAYASAQWPKPISEIPAGLGYGPADVAAALVMPDRNPPANSPPAAWKLLLEGGAAPARAVRPTADQGRPAPRLDGMIEGRYGSDGKPGSGGNPATRPVSDPKFWLQQSRSPTDLKARLQVFTELVGTEGSGQNTKLTFFMPTPLNDQDRADLAHDPYAARLDGDAPRLTRSRTPNWSLAATDNPFTLGELESVLRPYDADAATLPPRLTAALDELAERSRFTITTESWDTPGLVGEASKKIIQYAAAMDNPYDGLSPDVAAGLRFDINQPIGKPQGGTGAIVVDKERKQSYFKHLFTMLVALGRPASEETAQWVANVIEFRDPDSLMTWYPYDTNPQDGWDVSGNPAQGVWGAERPEVMIKAVNPDPMGPIQVTLHRPWNAVLKEERPNNQEPLETPVEVIDAALAKPGAENNLLCLTRRDNNNQGSVGVWRLRALVGDNPPPGATIDFSAQEADSFDIPVGSDIQAPELNADNPTAIVLERLADPTRARSTDTSNPETYNDYVVVDRVTLPAAPLPSTWFHWPNRDFISHGELAAVPKGSPEEMMQTYRTGVPAACVDDSPLILDATIVPSRFAGAAVSVANPSSLTQVGYQDFPYGQLSRWREPGRVNVNTLLENHENALSALDDAVWKAVSGREIHNPFIENEEGGDGAGRSDPAARSISEILLHPDLTPDVSPSRDSTGLRLATAIRLANVATVRSHVFAIWITLEMTSTGPNAPEPTYHRLFAIVDRSIPVGFSEGENLNVREIIRLKRFLE